MVRNLSRGWFLRFPDLTGFKIWGSARGREDSSKRSGLGRGASILAPPFSPRTKRATVSGFDRIAWAHKSVTQGIGPYKTSGPVFFAQCIPFSFFLLCFSTAFALTLDAAAPYARNLLRWGKTRRRL